MHAYIQQQSASFHSSSRRGPNSTRTCTCLSYSTRFAKSVLSKRSCQRALATDLLAGHEALYCDGNGTVDVHGGTVLAQPHFAEGFGDADDGFEMTDLWGRLVDENKGDIAGNLR